MDLDLRVPAILPAPQLMIWNGDHGRLNPVRQGTLPSDFSNPSAEAYSLEIGPGGAVLAAVTEKGMANGRRTLEQLRRQTAGDTMHSGLVIRDWPTLKWRGLHINMRYHPPRFDWLLGWLDQLAMWKLNLIVLEYEDRLHYKCAPAIAGPHAWTHAQVREFVAKAGSLGIEVAPLVQCLGHMEAVLVHDCYAGLREAPDAYTQACPCNPDTAELLKAMLAEVMELHPNSPFIHLGADETAFLGHCPKCAAEVEKVGKLGLYTGHIARLCEWVIARGRRPMIWDDILRRNPDAVLGLPKETILDYWNYGMTDERIDLSKPDFNMEDVFGIKRRDEKPKIQPYVEYRQKGYDVLMSPCFNAHGAANCRQHAMEAAQYGCLGVMATSWSDCGVVGLSEHGAAAAADAAWNPLPGLLERATERRPSVSFSFDRRFCRGHLGLDDDTLIHALRLPNRGYMFAPGGQVFPTLISTYTFVDCTFLITAHDFKTWGAALFRSDWETPARAFTPEKTADAKIQALLANPAAGHLAAVASDQLRGTRRALELLSGLAPTTPAGREFVEAALAETALLAWRLEYLLCRFAGKPVPALPAGLAERLLAVYAGSLYPEDARELLSWHLAPVLPPG